MANKAEKKKPLNVKKLVVSDVIKKFQSSLVGLDEDAAKFDEGNKAAAARLRKSLADLRAGMQELRKAIIAKKKILGVQKKAGK